MLLLLSVALGVVAVGGGSAAQASPSAAAPAQTAGCGSKGAPVQGDKRAVAPAAPNPLTHEKWFVDDTPSRFGFQGYHEPAEGAFQHASGTDKALYGQIANTPRFFWYGKSSGDSLTPGRGLDDLRTRVCANIAAAQAQGSVPLLTVLRAQATECNSHYQGGGPQEDAATRAWYDAFADAVGGSRAIIAFEPDSTGTIDCLARARRDGRIALLRTGVERLAQLPNATVYIEATASDWKPVGETVSTLRRMGVADVRGFMLNVTHFDWTNANLAYGDAISRKLGGKHFIVNTSANGRGPVHLDRRVGSRTRRVVVNCHPLLRGLGPRPTTATGDGRADAFMWISRPGYSSGTCNGGPKTGDWWPKRALQLARYATQLRGPRPGTRFGFPKGRVSARQAAGDQY